MPLPCRITKPAPCSPRLCMQDVCLDGGVQHSTFIGWRIADQCRASQATPGAWNGLQTGRLHEVDLDSPAWKVSISTILSNLADQHRAARRLETTNSTPSSPGSGSDVRRGPRLPSWTMTTGCNISKWFAPDRKSPSSASTLAFVSSTATKQFQPDFDCGQLTPVAILLSRILSLDLVVRLSAHGRLSVRFLSRHAVADPNSRGRSHPETAFLSVVHRERPVMR